MLQTDIITKRFEILGLTMSPKALCVLIMMVIMLLTDEASSQRGDMQQMRNNGSGGNLNRECKSNGGYNWITCIMLKFSCNPKACKRFSHLSKNITCVSVKQRCGGCKAKYYLNGEELQCNPIKQKGYECAPGVRKVDCHVDPCESTTCDTELFRTAECKADYCGGCHTKYYVHDKWQDCPVSVLAIQPDARVAASEADLRGNSRGSAFASVARQASGDGVLSSDSTRPFRNAPKARRPPISASVCPNGTKAHECPPDICRDAVCPSYPSAKCSINNCGGCKAEFRSGIFVVEDCNSNECPPNTFPFQCRDDPCKYATCVNFKHLNPVCKPSRCGGCHAKWFVNGEEVDCTKQPENGDLCPNGQKKNTRCDPNICRFTKCPGDRTVTCTVNYCGCYADYRDSQNRKVECRGWWNIPDNRKKAQSQLSVVDSEPLLEAPPVIDPVISENEILGFEPLQLNAPVQPVSVPIRKPEDAQARRQATRASKRTNTVQEKPVNQQFTLNLQIVDGKDTTVGSTGRKDSAQSSDQQQLNEVNAKGINSNRFLNSKAQLRQNSKIVNRKTTSRQNVPQAASVKNIAQSVVPAAPIKVDPPPVLRQAHRSTSQAIDTSTPMKIPAVSRQQVGEFEPLSDSKRAPRQRVHDTRLPPFKPIVKPLKLQPPVQPTPPKPSVQNSESNKIAAKPSDFGVINLRTGHTISIPPGLFDLLLQSMNTPGVPVQAHNAQRTR